MNSIKTIGRIHPLVAGAAIAVIVLSAVGVAAITGVLPTSHGTTATPESAMSVPGGNVPTAPVAGVAPPPPNTPPPPPQNYPDGTPPAPLTPTPYAAPNGSVVACHLCGTVEAVRVVQVQAKPTGVGAVAGALLGGLIGNRFGGGNGRALTTVGGAVGGGIAGNEIEKHAHTSNSYLVEVRMENGKMRSFQSATQPGWNVGDQVKVVDGRLMARG
jgi:outer membrane lipoprotein SlyB